jgi:hypothetical protein
VPADRSFVSIYRNDGWAISGSLVAQTLNDRLMRKQHCHTGVAQFKRKSFRGFVRLHRYVCTPRFQNRENRDNHLGRALHADSDRRFDAHPEAGEMTRQLIGAVVQFAVRQYL